MPSDIASLGKATALLEEPVISLFKDNMKLWVIA